MSILRIMKPTNKSFRQNCCPQKNFLPPLEIIGIDASKDGAHNNSAMRRKNERLAPKVV